LNEKSLKLRMTELEFRALSNKNAMNAFDSNNIITCKDAGCTID